jgi:hypothetical protein
MKHAPEIARLLGQELNDPGPKPVPRRAALGNFLRGSREVKPYGVTGSGWRAIAGG